MTDYSHYQDEISENGFTVINDVYSEAEVNDLIAAINDADKSNPTFRKNADLFAIRQFLKEVPQIKTTIFNED